MAMKTYYPTLLSLIFVLYAGHTHAQKNRKLTGHETTITE
jgi:hypothetical protein